ncbi:MAG: plasmid pRiA4b ORF-3 family protein [Trebonia sp.]
MTLRGVSKPPVWRRILVPVTMSLGELHEVIVRAMGWDGGHLHVFSDGMFQYGAPDGELGHQDEDDTELDEVLSGPGDKLSYTYDFGDDWEHDIRLEKVLPPDAATAVPACLAGKGACPPEDCGGAWGYASLKEAIADPADEEHQELLEWLGLDDPSDFDPTAFNLDYANARVSGAGSTSRP